MPGHRSPGFRRFSRKTQENQNTFFLKMQRFELPGNYPKRPGFTGIATPRFFCFCTDNSLSGMKMAKTKKHKRHKAARWGSIFRSFPDILQWQSSKSHRNCRYFLNLSYRDDTGSKPNRSGRNKRLLNSFRQHIPRMYEKEPVQRTGGFPSVKVKDQQVVEK